jgi:hypothetical protein
MLVTVAEVVLAELSAGLAEGLQQFGDGRHVLGDGLRRSRHADGQEPGAERILTQDKGGAAGRAGLLGVNVG